MASFDFLETMSTSVSDIGSAELLSDKGGGRCVSEDDDGSSVDFTSVKKGINKKNRRQSSYENDENRHCGSGSLHSMTAAVAASLDDKMTECRSVLMDSGRNTSSMLRDFCNEMKLSAQTLTSHEDADERLSLSDSCAESFSCSSSNLHLEI